MHVLLSELTHMDKFMTPDPGRWSILDISAQKWLDTADLVYATNILFVSLFLAAILETEQYTKCNTGYTCNSLPVTVS